MAVSKAIRYILLRPFQQKYQNDAVSPIYNPSPTRRQCLITWAVGVVLFLGLVYICWPSGPVLKIERMKLHRIKVHTLPRLTVDISMLVTVKVRNGDVYSMDYKSLNVAVGYRGKKLGHVRSEHGHVRAKGSSYVDARLEFAGIRVLSDVVFFLEDLAKGTIPFDTSTEVDGHLGLLFFGFPMEAKLICEVLVNTANQAIERQMCHRKVVAFLAVEDFIQVLGPHRVAYPSILLNLDEAIEHPTEISAFKILCGHKDYVNSVAIQTSGEMDSTIKLCKLNLT